MARTSLILSALTVVFLLLFGCGFVPGLNQAGLLPGPSPTLLLDVVPMSMLSGLLSQYGEIGTQDCPDGEVWIGTLNLGGTSMTLNACVPTELATQYARNAGVL